MRLKLDYQKPFDIREQQVIKVIKNRPIGLTRQSIPRLINTALIEVFFS